jgi:hypothetical protein
VLRPYVKESTGPAGASAGDIDQKTSRSGVGAGLSADDLPDAARRTSKRHCQTVRQAACHVQAGCRATPREDETRSTAWSTGTAFGHQDARTSFFPCCGRHGSNTLPA